MEPRVRIMNPKGENRKVEETCASVKLQKADWGDRVPGV